MDYEFLKSIVLSKASQEVREEALVRLLDCCGIATVEIGSVKVTKAVYKEIKKFSETGLKIQAIKALREHTRLGLKESKDVIDAYWEKNGYSYESKSPNNNS